MSGTTRAQTRLSIDRPQKRLRTVAVSIVVPLYNEVESVYTLLEELAESLDGRIDYEVLCVDDGSTDGTGALLECTEEALPRVRTIRHRERAGQSAAILTGARAARFPWILTMDGDGQNNPSDILRLVAALEEPKRARELKLVAGIRRKRRDSWLKRTSSRLANAVRRRLLRDDVIDTGCGLKLIDREAFLALPTFDHMHRFLPALIRRNGGELTVVDVDHRPRRQGHSKYGLHDRLWVGIVDLFGMLWLARRRIEPKAFERPGGAPPPPGAVVRDW